MPTVCVVSHCRRLYQKGNDVHFHKVPSEPHRRAMWLRAINRDGPNGMGTLIGFVCSDHFLPEDYETNLNVLRSLGMDTKHARLKRDAVPTQNLGAPPRKRKRSEELPDSQDVVDVLTTGEEQTSLDVECTVPEEEKTSLDVKCTLLEEEKTSARMVENWTQTTGTSCTTVPCQTDCADVQSRCTQVNLRIVSTTPAHTQTDARQSICARCEASNAASTVPTFAPPLHSPPLPPTSSIAAPSLLSHRALSPIHFTPLRSSSPVDSVTSESEEEENAEECSEFLPSFNESFSGLDSSTEELPPQNERKFIIFESCLMQLFKVCRTCFAACRSVSRVSGTLLEIETLCANNHFLTWKSQPMMSGKPAGNVLISAAILFSGTSPTSVLRMFGFVNVQVFTPRTFFNYQRGYLLPAIDKIWQQQQQELFHQLQGCNVDLAGDGRCDSPGFSAKFMTYSLHVAQLNKILHFEQVQVGECEDVKSSTCMEKYAFAKSLKVVKERGLKVTSVTTDRHVQVTKHMRMHEPTIKHYFDAWHISKGIKKKLAAHSKRAGCSVLELWIQPASNHLHWCAAISDGNAELLTDMWKSMERHVANLHSGHSGLYTHCAHGDLGERQWLIPGTPAHDKFADVVMAPRLLKDIRQLAPSTHTFSLEAFHSVLIGFAPKSVCFSPEGMRARTALAVLHFNENVSKAQASTSEGVSRWKVKHPKARKGTAVACPVKAEPTYDYVDLLLEETARCCEQWPSFKAAFAANPSTAPPPMSHSFPRPSKPELVASRRSRFANGTTSTTL